MNRREFTRLLALGLGMGLTGLPLSASAAAKPRGVTLDPQLPLHPALQYGAIAEPDKVVSVIVQKIKGNDDGRKIASEGEATHQEEFNFIKSHLLEIRQGKLLKLARHPKVLYVSPDTPVRLQGIGDLQTSYPQTLHATDTWSARKPSTGKGITVAVLDTGCATGPDFVDSRGYSRVRQVKLNLLARDATDRHGHGTHVGGIIAGRSADGRYSGIAPDANLIGVKIADDQGRSLAASVVRGLQWCLDNAASIDVVTLSLSSATMESYLTSPICAAVEKLWLAGIPVVVSAGNLGAIDSATWYTPANDPYVITVGALDDNQTSSATDNTLAPFSGRGLTQEGIAKPDVVAPGRRIVSVNVRGSILEQTYPDRIVAGGYLRLSGTSMAAPMVAGTIALILQQYPLLTPDQLKWLLTTQAEVYPGQADGAGLVRPDRYLAYLANNATNARLFPLGQANQGLVAASTLATTKTSFTTTSAYWDSAYWDSAYWDSAYWDSALLD